MLAGLLFAILLRCGRSARAVDPPRCRSGDPDRYRTARLLIAAGASQIVILVARLTPELLGAIGHAGKRGVAVDTVRTAGEAAAKLHPLARVLMLADGLDHDRGRTGGTGARGRRCAAGDAGGSGDRRLRTSAVAWSGRASRGSTPRGSASSPSCRDHDVQSNSGPSHAAGGDGT